VLFDWVAALGRHSLIVYLAFFLPMAVTRIVLVKTGLIADVGTVSLMVTVAALIGPFIIHAVTRRLGLTFLFERPTWFRVPAGRSRRAAVAAG
jgi:uncharacterized membrane protein YcfT